MDHTHGCWALFSVYLPCITYSAELQAIIIGQVALHTNCKQNVTPQGLAFHKSVSFHWIVSGICCTNWQKKRSFERERSQFFWDRYNYHGGCNVAYSMRGWAQWWEILKTEKAPGFCCFFGINGLFYERLKQPYLTILLYRFLLVTQQYILLKSIFPLQDVYPMKYRAES